MTRFNLKFEYLPLAVFIAFLSVALFGVYYLAAHPADQGPVVNINGSSEANPYFIAGELPDLDNCPGGPNAQPCRDEFGVQISCYNPNQNDGDFDLLGDICDSDTQLVPPPALPTAVTISGIVTSSSLGNQPVSGADVTISGGASPITVKTSGSGQYSFGNITPSQAYTVSVVMPGFTSSAPQSITPTADSTLPPFDLTSTPMPISGKVMQGSGTGIGGADVRLYRLGAEVAQVNSDSVAATLGNYTFSSVLSGWSYQVLGNGSTIGYNDNVPSVNTPFTLTASRSNENIVLTANAFTISGTVRNASNNNPINNATVEVLSGATVVTTATTNSSGGYTINNVPGGATYTVRGSASGFVTATNSSFTLTGDRTENIALGIATFTISGTVRNASNNNPISGATVEVLSGATVVTTVTTNSSGGYTISNVPGGATYSVRGSASGFVTATNTSFTLNAPRTENINLNVATFTITGTVRDAATTNPIQGVVVRVLQGATVIGSTNTGANGTYSIANVPAGSGYTMSATHTSYQPFTSPSSFAVSGNMTQNINLSVTTFTISGTVRDAATTNPLAAATVELLDAAGNPIVGRTDISDTAGFYEFTGVAGGATYSLRGSTTNYDTKTNPQFALNADRSEDINLTQVISFTYHVVGNFDNSWLKKRGSATAVTFPDASILVDEDTATDSGVSYFLDTNIFTDETLANALEVPFMHLDTFSESWLNSSSSDPPGAGDGITGNSGDNHTCPARPNSSNYCDNRCGKINGYSASTIATECGSLDLEDSAGSGSPRPYCRLPNTPDTGDGGMVNGRIHLNLATGFDLLHIVTASRDTDACDYSWFEFLDATTGDGKALRTNPGIRFITSNLASLSVNLVSQSGELRNAPGQREFLAATMPLSQSFHAYHSTGPVATDVRINGTNREIWFCIDFNADSVCDF